VALLAKLVNAFNDCECPEDGDVHQGLAIEANEMGTHEVVAISCSVASPLQVPASLLVWVHPSSDGGTPTLSLRPFLQPTGL
jgi:hypothetical protein